jgi:hypothetical protein
MTTGDVGRPRNGNVFVPLRTPSFTNPGSTGRFAMLTAPDSLRSPAMLRMDRGLGGIDMDNLVLKCHAQGLSAAEGSSRDAAALAAGAYTRALRSDRQ